MDREGLGAIARDCLENGIGALGPDERLGIGIVGVNENGDVGLEFLDTAMDATLDLLVSEQREPAFDLIKPGGAGRGEVQVIARVAGEPGRAGRSRHPSGARQLRHPQGAARHGLARPPPALSLALHPDQRLLA